MEIEQILTYLLHSLTQIGGRNRAESMLDRFCSVFAANLLSDYVIMLAKLIVNIVDVNLLPICILWIICLLQLKEHACLKDASSLVLFHFFIAPIYIIYYVTAEKDSVSQNVLSFFNVIVGIKYFNSNYCSLLAFTILHIALHIRTESY